MKRRSLTNLYLELMYAFYEVSNNKLESCRYLEEIYGIAIMQEHCTLRLDGGRQTGKTEACIKFVDDWIDQGNTLIYLSKNLKTFEEFKKGLKNNASDKIFGIGIRTFLSDDCSRFRGFGIKKSPQNDNKHSNGILIVIDEPCYPTEMYKYYEAYMKHVHFSVSGQQRENKSFPIFFVLGVQ